MSANYADTPLHKQACLDVGMEQSVAVIATFATFVDQLLLDRLGDLPALASKLPAVFLFYSFHEFFSFSSALQLFSSLVRMQNIFLYYIFIFYF